MWDELFGKQRGYPTQAQIDAQRATYTQRARFAQGQALGGLGGLRPYLNQPLNQWECTEVMQLKEKIKELEAKLQEPESKKLERIREHNKKLLERVAYYEKLKED